MSFSGSHGTPKGIRFLIGTVESEERWNAPNQWTIISSPV
jgi:hypothetical protein